MNKSSKDAAGSPIRILVFENSKSAKQMYKEKAKNANVDIMILGGPYLDEKTQQKIQEFCPRLIVVDLLFYKAKEEGYKLINNISEIPSLKKLPIVVVSKYINDTPNGRKVYERCLEMPGVVEAYSKLPDYPIFSQILSHID